MAEDLGDKTESATPRRLSEAREEGRVAKSQDLAAAIDLFGAFILFLVFGLSLAKAMGSILRRTLESGADTTVAGAFDLARAIGIQGAIAILPFLGLVCVVAIAAHTCQFGLLFSTKILTPNVSKLNPIAGLGKLFNKRNLVKTIVNSLKLIVVSLIGYLFLRSCAAQLATLPMLGAAAAWAVIGRLTLELAAWLFTILLVMGVVDYLFQRWNHLQELRMTKEQVKDERRSMEGDPQIKGRRLRMARQIAMQRINSAVPNADVIVTNPTHYSIAIKYDQETMHAPKVVAKGADEMAMRIREIARVHKVPIVERPPLARALYKTIPVGGEVRPEFYEAVAELLAFVYRLNESAGSARPREAPAPEIKTLPRPIPRPQAA